MANLCISNGGPEKGHSQAHDSHLSTCTFPTVALKRAVLGTVTGLVLDLSFHPQLHPPTTALIYQTASSFPILAKCRNPKVDQQLFT